MLDECVKVTVLLVCSSGIVATVPPRTVATIPKKKGKVPHQSTITATVLAHYKHTECIVPKHCNNIDAIVKFVVY